MLSSAQRQTFTAGMLTLLVALAAAMAIEAKWSVDCLEATGTKTTAVIADMRTHSAKGGQKYILHYRFVAPEGRVVEGRHYVGRERFERTNVGGTVVALYCPANPWRNTLDLVRLREDLRVATLIWLVVTAGLVLFLAYLWGRARLEPARREQPLREDAIDWSTSANRFPRRIGR